MEAESVVDAGDAPAEGESGMGRGRAIAVRVQKVMGVGVR